MSPSLADARPAGTRASCPAVVALCVVWGWARGGAWAQEPAASPQEPGIAFAALDAETRQPIAEFRVIGGVPSSSFDGGEFEKRTGQPVVNWQPHTVKLGRDGRFVWPLRRGWEKTAFRVEADGYQPQRTAIYARGDEPAEIEILLAVDTKIRGRILQPDGAAAAGATMALALPQRGATIRAGKLSYADEPLPEKPTDQWRRPTMVKTDADGRFEFPIETDPASALLVVHDSGVREMPFAEFRKHPAFVLQPWGRVEGQVLWHDKPGADLPVSLITFRSDYGYPGMIEQYGDARSDAKGRFTVERVLPGRTQLSIPLPVDDTESGASSVMLEVMTTYAEVAAGEPTRVMIGGQGRTVRGRLTGREAWDDVTIRVRPDAPPMRFPEGWAAFSKLEQGETGPVFFRDGLAPEDDGTLELPHMLPGSYQLFVRAPGVENWAGSARFDVGAETPGEEPEAMDVGEISVKEAE